MAQSSPTPLRTLSLPDFAAMMAEGERLGSSQVRASGGWTIAQALEHLRLTMRLSRDPEFVVKVGLGLRLMRPIIKPMFKSPKFKMKSGFTAPEGLAPPKDVRIEDALPGFLAEAKVCDEPGVMTQPSPLLGSMTEADWRRLHLLHTDHHLSFFDVA